MGLAPHLRAIFYAASLVTALPDAGTALDGLWAYESIGRAGGTETPIEGLFLFRDGYTVQSSLNQGEPFDRQLAQAHFGTYRPADRDFVLISSIGLVVDPTKDPPLDSRRNAEHHFTVQRSGDRLTLTFATGTIQRFRRVGAGAGDLVLLKDGALALVDGRFLIVTEWGNRALAGSGTYERRGSVLDLHADRWFSLKDGRPTYRPKTTIRASFDGRELRLPGEPPLHVKDSNR